MGGAPIKDNDQLHSDPITKASLLNAQFRSVFVKDDKGGSSPIQTGDSCPAIDILNISARVVEKLLSKLAVNKEPDPDQLSNNYLRETAKQTVLILATMFSQSLKTGVLPSDWKQSMLVKFSKRETDIQPASNYRPVSLTCVCC